MKNDPLSGAVILFWVLNDIIIFMTLWDYNYISGTLDN